MKLDVEALLHRMKRPHAPLACQDVSAELKIISRNLPLGCKGRTNYLRNGEIEDAGSKVR